MTCRSKGNTWTKGLWCCRIVTSITWDSSDFILIYLARQIGLNHREHVSHGGIDLSIYFLSRNQNTSRRMVNCALAYKNFTENCRFLEVWITWCLTWLRNTEDWSNHRSALNRALWLRFWIQDKMEKTFADLLNYGLEVIANEDYRIDCLWSIIPLFYWSGRDWKGWYLSQVSKIFGNLIAFLIPDQTEITIVNDDFFEMVKFLHFSKESGLQEKQDS